MDDAILCSWPEISQAADGLQLNSTAATWEYVRTWLDRLETRLVEHERRAAATLPPLRPEPDPPDALQWQQPQQPEMQDWRWQQHQPHTQPVQTRRPTSWDPPDYRQQSGFMPYDQYPLPYHHREKNQPLPSLPCYWDPPAQQALHGFPPHNQSYLAPQPQLDPTPPSEAPSYGLPTWDYCVQQEHHAYDQQQYKQWQNCYNQTQTEIPAAYTPSWRPESTPSIFAPVQSVAVTKFESEEVIYGSMYGSEHRLRDQEGAMSDSSILDTQIEYSCDDAKDFNCVSDRGVVEEEHCVTLDRGLSTDSILETKANKVIDCGTAYLNTGNQANHTMGLSSNISREEDDSSEERREIQCIVEEHKAIDEHEVAFEATNLGLKVERDVRRRLFDDERRLQSKQLGKREGAYTGLKIIAYGYGDLYVANATSFDHQLSSFDDDSRWIPPLKDTPCLSILGRVDRLPVLTLTFGNQSGHSLMIFDGGDERRNSLVLCPFDPGGDASPKLLLSTLSAAS